MPLRALRRLGWFRVLLAAELLVALSVTGGLWLLHRQTLDAEGRMLAALARAMALQADRTLEVGTTVLRTTRDELTRGLVLATAADAPPLLRERVRALPGYRSLGLFDLGGEVLAPSGPMAAGTVPAFAGVVAAVRAAPAGRAVLCELRPAGPDGPATPALAMGWRDAAGQLQGVILIGATPDWLDGGFERVAGDGDVGRRIVRAGGSALPGAVQADDPAAQPSAASLEAWAAPAHAQAVPVRAGDGGRQWLVVAQPLAELPLVQLVWHDLDAVLSAWTDLAWLVGAFVAAMLGVTFALGLRLARDQLRVEGLERRLERGRKLEAMGQLAGGVAHDFNNVLAAVVGFGELARDEAPADGRQARHLDQVLRAAERGRQQVERILAFSSGQPRRQVVFRLQPLLHEVLDHLPPASGTGVSIERPLHAPALAVRGDPAAAYEAVMNLCTNALQAMRGGGRLEVSLDEQRLTAPRQLYDGMLPPGRYARVRVRDSGQGMPPEVLAHLFEPFYTTRGRDGGTGIGLAVVHGVVADLGGGIDVVSTPGHGTCFTLLLPVCDEPPDDDEAADTGLPRGQGQTVLVVDDEAALVELAEEMLAALGYEPLGTTSAERALQAFGDDPDRFQLLLADELMPGMTGTALACRLRELQPALPVVLVTGHGGGRFEARAAQAGVQVTLAKPYTRAGLAQALHRARRLPLQS
jgi:signal transduction histidine kinase/CheY-like chemotaxis protein